MGFILSKLTKGAIWKRLLRERLSEPLHLNAISAAVAMFGDFRSKVDFDLVVRPQHAYCLLTAADQAKKYGYTKVTALEFGVANGAGLQNMCAIAEQVTKATGIEFEIVGFDTGKGMPDPIDYRDHPEAYQPGWFPMQEPDKLRAALPPNAHLIIGDVAETAPAFLKTLTPEAPIGFMSLDVDYYSSSVDALRVLAGRPELYLPVVGFYADDINFIEHNKWSGELLAIEEFNEAHTFRKIAPHQFLRESRIFQRAKWIGHIFILHVLDHPRRATVLKGGEVLVLSNPYLNLGGNLGRRNARKAG